MNILIVHGFIESYCYKTYMDYAKVNHCLQWY